MGAYERNCSGTYGPLNIACEKSISRASLFLTFKPFFYSSLPSFCQIDCVQLCVYMTAKVLEQMKRSITNAAPPSKKLWNEMKTGKKINWVEIWDFEVLIRLEKVCEILYSFEKKLSFRHSSENTKFNEKKNRVCFISNASRVFLSTINQEKDSQLFLPEKRIPIKHIFSKFYIKQ